MKTIVTKQSRVKRQEQHDLYSKRIDAAKIDKEEARSQGDLSENFGYDAAIKAIANYRRIQAELGLEAPGVEVVDPAGWCDMEMDDEPRARLGAKVTIERNGVPQTFLIGGAWDLDLNQEGVIPYTSPLAKAIIPKPVGFSTTFGTSGETIVVVASSTPTREEILAVYGTPEKKKAAPAQTHDKAPDGPCM